jgi:hypothetical protein
MAQLSPEQRQQAIRSMVEGLAARLADNPQDRAGWLRLANAWKVLGDGEMAADAYGRADTLGPVDARILAEPAPSCAVTGLITGGTQLQLRLWVATGDYWGVHGEVVTKVHRLYQDQQLTPPLLALATTPA